MKKVLVIVGFMLLTVAGYLYFGKENAFTTPAKPPSASGLAFHTEHINEQIGDCPTKDVRCLVVSLNYPVAEHGIDSAREKINNYTKSLLLGSIHLGEEPMDPNYPLDSALMDFGEDYKDFLEEMPEFDMAWAVEANGQVSLETKNLISLQFSFYSYLGGAHPNTFVEMGTFSKETGDKLGISEILKDTSEVLVMAEQYFRDARKLGPDVNLESEGFWFKNGQFSFPLNYAMEPGGLRLYYNPYEVGPYVLGPTEVMIPLEKIQPYLKIEP
ncbi:MAG: DUF3298 and DUF4163 domain-containing protein [Saprospiraceae bacterium]